MREEIKAEFWTILTNPINNAVFINFITKHNEVAKSLLAQPCPNHPHKGELGWLLLCRFGSHDDFSALLHNNIKPTANMLAQIDADQISGWLMLCRRTELYLIFKILLYLGVKPTGEMLSQKDCHENSGWSLLSSDSDWPLRSLNPRLRYDEPKRLDYRLLTGQEDDCKFITGIELFSMLLDLQIYPKQASLGQINWRNILNSRKLVLSHLLKMEDKPTAEMIAQQGGWHLLCDNHRYVEFEQLLDNHIIPTTEILAQEYNGNQRSVWELLCYGRDYHEKPDGTYVSGHSIIYKLLQLNVIPTTNMLSGSGLGWRALFNTNPDPYLQPYLTLSSLFDLGIMPTQEMCAKRFPDSLSSDSLWNIIIDRVHIDFFLRLLNAGILPTDELLAQQRDELIANIWCSLCGDTYFPKKNPQKMAAFKALLENGFIPTAEMLGQFYIYNGYSGWMGLLLNESEPEMTDALRRLGVVPSEQNIADCMSHSKQHLYPEDKRKLAEKKIYLLSERTRAFNQSSEKYMERYSLSSPLVLAGNNVTRNIYFPAVYFVGLAGLAGSKNRLALDCVMHVLLDFMLPAEQKEIVKRMVWSKTDGVFNFTQNEQFKVWQFLTLQLLYLYSKHNKFIFRNEYVNRADSIFEEIKKNEKSLKDIFKLIWLQCYLLTAGQRAGYKHPYPGEKESCYVRPVASYDVKRSANLLLVLRASIRMFPSRSIHAAFKKNELPILTMK